MGGSDDGPVGGFAGSGVGLGHSDMLGRKRSLDNMENVPPFGLDAGSPLSGGIDKPAAASLLDIAAQQLSQKQRKQRRTVITASSPGGHQRMAANPRRAAEAADGGLLRSQTSAAAQPKTPAPQAPRAQAQSQPQPQRQNGPGLQPRPTPGGRQQQHYQQQYQQRTPTPAPAPAPTAPGGARQLRRMPKRNLKPLDFSGLHRPKVQPATAEPVTAAATAINKHGARHSSGGGPPPGANILALPVSPAQSSPLSAAAAAALLGSSPGLGPMLELPRPAQLAQPTPPGTAPRQPAAFSGLLASAYRRASARRSSKRALCFGSDDAAAEDGDGSLLDCDPVLGPRCPVIGGPRGIFGLPGSGGGGGGSSSSEVPRPQPGLSDMARTVRQAQAEFEASVAEQALRSQPPLLPPPAAPAPGPGPAPVRRKPGRPPGPSRGRGRGRGKSAGPGRRPVSECKYCGKQYKYHNKLASHEQHCSSRLEALLYSADEAEQHTIHCICGPRHERPVGARDDLPMVQCDNCLLWLHIECVDIDEDNLPEEFFCPRCKEGFDAAAAPAPAMMSPASHRLAALLVDVPDNDGSETEEEPMCLRAGRQPGAARAPDTSSECTMSISDVAEVARFHRQGSAARRHRSPPAAPRLAQSESNACAPTPARRRVRAAAAAADADGARHAVHTDALSSDFLGLPLPESIFSEKPTAGASFMGAPPPPPPAALAPDLSRFLSDTQPQWSLEQLTGMLAAGSAAAAGSSGYLDQALADLGLGLGAAAAAAAAAAASAEPAASTAGPAEADPPLQDLVSLPADNDFSALLESIASGGLDADADAYPALGVDDLLDVGAPVRARIGGAIDVGHGSSSTITIMHGTSSLGLGSQDAPPHPRHQPRRLAPARPPPGHPGMARGGKTKRATRPEPIVLSLPSNPPSATGAGDLDLGSLIAGAAHAPVAALEWPADGDALEELEGLINFDG
ncbi:hypothetical protein H4R18_000105 [Coemansia javaensis]|uniref:PHD-type domain-containing protein n=1 Tax=Coemansia javaensis TaxID=2761396 RepID=A0A9W8HIZ8_9FUNG|nr:hypothetical protein H4R18_000105 [Coemansia javaensis]